MGDVGLNPKPQAFSRQTQAAAKEIRKTLNDEEDDEDFLGLVKIGPILSSSNPDLTSGSCRQSEKASTDCADFRRLLESKSV